MNHPGDRAIVATFIGALLLGFIYTTKPTPDTPGITLARHGNTAIVIDTAFEAQSATPEGLGSQVASADSFPIQISSPGTKPGDVSPNSVRPRATDVAGMSYPEVVPADIDALRRLSIAVPVAGVPASKLVDSFDQSRDGTRRHNAMDIMAARNTPVVAVADGRVLKLHNSKAGGLTIYASDASQRYIFLYGHLEGFRVGLSEGITLKRGETIGFVGSTGNANPAGPHLHFAIARSDNVNEWWKGTPLNPFLVFRGR